jgi:hypothetical protein
MFLLVPLYTGSTNSFLLPVLTSYANSWVQIVILYVLVNLLLNNRCHRIRPWLRAWALRNPSIVVGQPIEQDRSNTFEADTATQEFQWLEREVLDVPVSTTTILSVAQECTYGMCWCTPGAPWFYNGYLRRLVSIRFGSRRLESLLIVSISFFMFRDHPCEAQFPKFRIVLCVVV